MGIEDTLVRRISDSWWMLLRIIIVEIFQIGYLQEMKSLEDIQKGKNRYFLYLPA